MNLFLPLDCYNHIQTNVKTPTGRTSYSKHLYYYYIIHYLCWSLLFQKDNYKRGVPICTTVLKKLFNRGKIVNECLTYLEKNKIIEVYNESYKVGGYAKRYKLHKSVNTENLYMVEFDSAEFNLIKKLEIRDKRFAEENDQLHLIKSFLKVNENGKSFLTNKYGKSIFLKIKEPTQVDKSDIILLLTAKEIFFGKRPDLESRYYSNLTSLKRIYRDYILLNEKPLIMTDISNSQVLLSYPLIIKKMKELGQYDIKKIPYDLLLYKQLAEEGTFYDYLVNKSNNTQSRDEVKKRFFKETFFCKIKNHYKNESIEAPIGLLFKNLFPTVCFYINKIKKGNYKQFAIDLQRFEASIIIDSVYNDLRNENRCILTLHDAIVCNNIDDLERAEFLIKKHLFRHGLIPNFKRESGLKENQAA